MRAFVLETRELFAVGGWVLIALLLLGFAIAWTLAELWQYLGTDVSAPDSQNRLRRRFDFAFILIAAAPLLGLLGTVSGMFTTFDGMSSGRTAPLGVVSRGVSEALVTTQAGLIIAVPAFIVCTLLKTRFEKGQG